MGEQKEVHIVKKIDAAIKNEICTEMLRCMLKEEDYHGMG